MNGCPDEGGFFLLVLVLVVVLVVVGVVKVERRSEEMVGLQRVDWICRWVCGSGSDEFGGWFLGLLYPRWSAIVEGS